MRVCISKTQHCHLKKEYQNALSNLTTSPNAEGLQTNHHNKSPPWESRRQLLLTCKRSKNLKRARKRFSQKNRSIPKREIPHTSYLCAVSASHLERVPSFWYVVDKLDVNFEAAESERPTGRDVVWTSYWP